MIAPRPLFLQVLAAQLGRPYRWGGDDPLTGFDCSGLINEGAQAIGLLKRGEDRSAAEWAARTLPTKVPLLGDLLFWTDSTGKIIHMEALYDTLPNGTLITIGASGGGSATTDSVTASASNAYVKLRPARSGYQVHRLM